MVSGPSYNWLPHVVNAVTEIQNRFGIKVVGTYPGHDPTMSRAADFMTSNRSTHDAIFAYAIANARRLGIMYVISWNRIWSQQRSGEGVRAYTRYGGGGSPSQQHTNHVHISFNASAGTGGAAVISNQPPGTPTTPGPNAAPTDPNATAFGQIGELYETAKGFAAIAEWMTKPQNWLRILMLIVGIILMIIALGRSNPEAINKFKKVGKKVASVT